MVEAEEPIYAKLAELENEIRGLKLIVAELAEKPKGIVTLHGMLEGISVSEEDFKEAKHALFKLGA